MKIVITGVTGFIGKQLVPLLSKTNTELLLVGRDPQRIAQTFPSYAVCDYDALPKRAVGFDLLLHLAAINSDASGSIDAFRKVNVDLLLRTIDDACAAGISKVINVSSVHALDPANRSAYAQTKREAAAHLAEMGNQAVITAFLPATWGERWSGKLNFLNRLPRALARPAFRMLSTMQPTVHIERLAEFVLNGADNGPDAAIILSDGQQHNAYFRFFKRTLDLLFALSVALLFWWALAAIWVLIRLESPGPGIFAQQRVGREGRIFTCYKFRTMKMGTIQAATNLVSVTAVTRLGAFLRRTKLDELPQILNILRNEISLIGPRPCLPTQIELVEARRRRGVLSLKPGISGLAQINGIDMSDSERLAIWDARYGALQSGLLDLRILLATAAGRGGGDWVAKAA